MPIKVNSGETEQEFINRCIPIEIGYGKEIDVAQGICYSVWENRNMKKIKPNRGTSSYDRVLSKVNEINLLDPNPCQTGYVAYGTKIKDGREVPNCVPID